MKHFNKFLPFFLLPLFSLAQTNFKPGYVVTDKGDTLKGFVDYREWENNPSHIHFKNELNSNNVETYSVNNAKAFAVTGQEYYRRFIISVSQDPVEIEKLESKILNSDVSDTVFLKTVAVGKYITLYSYTDIIKTRYYVSDTENIIPQELIYKASYDPDKPDAIQYIRRYQTQLENIAQKYNVNNANLEKQILNARYGRPDLVRVAQIINGTSMKEVKSLETSGSRWFAGIGANYSNLKFGGSGIAFAGQNGSGSLLPKISAGIDFFTNKNVQRLVFRIEYTFTAAEYQFTADDNSLPTVPATISLNFKQYNNAVTPQIIYNIYNTDRLKAFIGAGIAFNVSIYSPHQTITKEGGSFQTTSSQDNFPEFQGFWGCFPVKAGLLFNKKIEINFSYTPPTAITSYDSFSGSLTAYQVGVNYMFGK